MEPRAIAGRMRPGFLSPMTINLLTSVPEGLVLLTDSMLTSQQLGPRGFESTNFEHATKLFELGQDARAAAMISGIGTIGTRLVSQLINVASAAIDVRMASGPIAHQDYVDEVAGVVSIHYDALVEQMKNQQVAFVNANPAMLQQINAQRAARGFQPINAFTVDNVGVTNSPGGSPYADIYIAAPDLEVIVASFDGMPSASSLKWPGALRSAIAADPGNVYWTGSGSTAVSRIIKGFDAMLLQQDAMTNPAAAQAFAFLSSSSARYQMPAAFAVMPLQEAVYFTEFLGHVAAGYDHFRAGPPGVGGDMSVLILNEACRGWIRRADIRSGLGEHFSGWSGMGIT